LAKAAVRSEIHAAHAAAAARHAAGLTAEEERELDNATAMLDQQNIFDASPDGLGANEVDVATQDNGMSDTNRSGNAQ
jgi:hypothetical protein